MFIEKVGILGDKKDTSIEELNKIKKFFQEVQFKELHHSGTISSEKIFHDICKGKNIEIVIHPTEYTNFKDFDVEIKPVKNNKEKEKEILRSCDLIIIFQNKKKILEKEIYIRNKLEKYKEKIIYF